jgi:3-oxoacyl-[acyl-carrier protein] reductase
MTLGTPPHVVLVTGASGGVGEGIAEACGQAGWTVWIAARREAQGLEVAAKVDAAGGTGHFIACDAADAASVDAAVSAIVDTHGRLDGVVHNATSGWSPTPVPLGEVTVENVRDQIAVSLRGTWLLAAAAKPHLVASQGALLLLTSEAGFEGKAKLATYAAVKGAVRGFGRALAREWGPDGVRVNAIAPLASTPALEKALEMDPAMGPRLFGRNPLGRMGDPTEDIGPVARFLLSPEARYLTGNTLMVDGGSCPIT